METLVASKTINVTIKASQGKPKNVITIPDTFTWGDLKARLSKEGYNMDNLEACNSVDNNSYNHPAGKLPKEDFRLYLFPRETKGGATSRSELYTKIKGYMALGDKAIAFFNEGQNYTRLSSPELEARIAKWEKKHGTAVGDVTVADKKSKATVKPSQQASLTPKPKKERVKGTKKEEDTTPHVQLPAAPCPEAEPITLASATEFLKTITGHENQDLISQAVSLLNKALQPKPTKSEDEILAEEEAFLKSGLRGIKK